MGKMEIVTGFIFLGSKFTADGDYSHEIKRYFLIGREAMTNLDSILKSRDITLLKEVCILKAMFFCFCFFSQKSCTNVRVGPSRMLGAKELMLSNCGVGEDS